MNTPNIRFKGYTDDWERRKLGDLVTIGDIDHRMPKTVENGIPYLMTGDFCGLNGLNFDGVKQVSEDDYEQLSRKIKPEKGDILFARYASVGAVRYVDFDDRFLISYSCAIIKGGENINSKYLYHYLTGEVAQKQIGLEINTGSQANIGIDSMKNNIIVTMPSDDEQKNLANLLDNLDNLITLHQRKCDDLKEVKKYMLQKMFPKKGEKVPEIRFKGFTGDWEVRKLGDFFTERSERASGDEELLSVTIGSGVIRQIDSDKRNTASEDKSNYKVVKQGDVPYNSMRMWQGAVGTSDYDGIVSPAYTVLTPKENANGKFFMELFKKESTLEIFKRWSQGLTSDTWNLKFPVLSTIVFAAPRVEEQSKIATYFTALDDQITLYQKKLDTLKEVKKFMLQNMFPQ